MELPKYVNKKSPINEFYAGKSVFITGASGFLGEVLLEKLLYSCEQIDKIYILLRKKTNIDGREQINKITNGFAFTRIRDEKPQELRKIVPVFGDVTLPDIGLNEKHKKALLENVSVVFHVAAAVKFSEPLKTALEINVGGSLKVLQLCKEIRKLEAFIHVSTAYANGDKRYIEEKVYPLAFTLDSIYDFAKQYTDTPSDRRQLEKLIGGRPNIYTLSKAVAEVEVEKNRGEVPTAIVRPSIVLSSLKEPVNGWIVNWNGPTASMQRVAEGHVRFLYGKGDIALDIIPVDIVTNHVIACALICKRNKGLTVYNCCTSPQNPIKMGRLVSLYKNVAVKLGENTNYFPETFYFIPWYLGAELISFLFVTIPYILADINLWLHNKPTKYAKLLRNIKVRELMLKPFKETNWRWSDANTRDLISGMSPTDYNVFYCNTADINWDSYIKDFYVGVRKFLRKL